MAIEFFETTAIIAGGKVQFTARELARFTQGARAFADGIVTVRIEKAHRLRTAAQNRFWHGVVIPLFAEHCGEPFEAMKRTLALELIPVEIKRLDGTVVIAPGHTADLNVTQFNDLIRRAQQLGAEMDLYVPDPNEDPLASTGRPHVTVHNATNTRQAGGGVNVDA